MKLIIVIFFAIVLVGCADKQPRPNVQEKYEIYTFHAGAEVDHVPFANARNWQPVGVNALMIEFGPRRHYLFTVAPPCDFDLRHVPSIAVINTQPNRVTRFDRIRVGADMCRILSIRSLDMEGVREDLERLDQDRPESGGEIRVETENQDSGGT